MQESESIGTLNQRRGIDSEKRVIKDFQSKNNILLFWRLKTPFAEVDLVFKDPDQRLCMVEVKTSYHDAFYSHRLQWNQKNRLLRAREYLQEQFKSEVYIQIALVERLQIHYYEID